VRNRGAAAVVEHAVAELFEAQDLRAAEPVEPGRDAQLALGGERRLFRQQPEDRRAERVGAHRAHDGVEASLRLPGARAADDEPRSHGPSEAGL
jgi:hypothetical protein